MEVPKIQLSSAEAELMNNAALILTKNSVLNKMKQLLESVQVMQMNMVEQRRLQHNEPFIISPKISRGENYMGLPYLILDYPRASTADSLFFIRTMFWWGNFFSSTLHMSGRFKETFLSGIMAAYPQLRDLFIGINEDPWIHHFEATNYVRIGNISRQEFESYCSRHSHLKLGACWPLDDWRHASVFLFEHWKFLLTNCGLIT
ncbi:MAG TPA: hypothetical protein VNR87_13560 [Flavisolibacter sp.]|nr:hypothetical protein [Flavisolibacter sp.]